MIKPLIVSTALSLVVLAGISGCAKKKFEDTDTYKELMKQQEETDRRLDSIRKDNYRQLTDSSNNSFKKSLDSLKHITDSLRENLDKNIKSLKK